MNVCFRCHSLTIEGANFCHQCGCSLEPGEFKPLTTNDPLTGRVIANRYRITSVIGRGGMGVVYKGEHIHMGKPVAIKLLSGEVASQKDMIKRFRREADAASKLTSVHTVTIFDYGQSQGLTYLVMEYLEGRDLAAVIRNEKQIKLPKVITILSQVCESLSEAHEMGIIHRDLKPENIFLIEKKRQQDFVKVLDFGLAKMKGNLQAPDETAHGIVLGTPYYMAPEQIRGEAIDARADIYSLGALMYIMLAGHPPFMGPTPIAVMAMHLTNQPPELPQIENLSSEELSALNAIIKKCMSKERDKRYSSVIEFKSELMSLSKKIDSESLQKSSDYHAESTSLDSLSVTPLDKTSSALKEEFERYEKILRLRRISAIFLPFVILAIIAVAIYGLITNLPEKGETIEKEPNDFPDYANTIQPGKKITGTIGKRISLTESDHDWFKLQIDKTGLLWNFELSGVPEMDIMFQIFQEGNSSAILTAKEGRKGEMEIMRNYSLEPGTYYILVREDLSSSGKKPTECISDYYSLIVSSHHERDFEKEPNNSFFDARQVTGGVPIRGNIDGYSDIDWFYIKCNLQGTLTGTTIENKFPLQITVFDEQLTAIQSSDCSLNPQIEIPQETDEKLYFFSVSVTPECRKLIEADSFSSTYTIKMQCLQK